MAKIIALAGNPNVGKSTIFNSLTGLKQHTGNWPGKTIMKATGSFQYEGNEYILVDLPGAYSLLGHCAEEDIARDYILSNQAELILVICDATCLERNLNLVLQILQLTKNVIVCINLLDEAAKKKITIDFSLLSDLLGVPIVGTCAVKQSLFAKNHLPVPNGLEDLKKAIKQFFQTEEKTDISDYSFESPIISEINFFENPGLVVNSMEAAEKIGKKTIVYHKADYDSRDRKLDSVLTSPVTGIPIMLCLLGVILWITLVGANYPSSLLSQVFLFIEEKLWQGLTTTPIPYWLCDLTIHGIYRVLTWVVAVMLPPMAIFFPLFTLLEDFGYLPRVAFNLDHPFRKCCSCGKQALTMCMGFGCNATGIIGCRIIDSPRERLLAILTNNFIPCNGRLPTLIVIISMFFVGKISGFFGVILLTFFILLGILMTFLISKLLSVTILKGVPSAFTLELPPYRTPQVGKVIISSLLNRTLFVLGRAIVVAVPAGLILWLMANISIGHMSLLNHCAMFLDPFARWIGLDGVILIAFILGFPANEIVIPIMIMAYMASGYITEFSSLSMLHDLLIKNGWTQTTALCTLLFSMMHWPCSTTCLTIKKETGSLKWTLLSILLPTLTGIIVCFITAQFCTIIIPFLKSFF